ncbi:hypothetical protein [Paenibacillus woosongensis]|uniref:hypothetical protein n=1 Tax=Paenibacillus woosongensis TaxID=307580 RepID=UPI003D322F2D
MNDPDYPLQKAGHAAVVETQNGEWYMSFICARTLPGRRLCPLGPGDRHAEAGMDGGRLAADRRRRTFAAARGRAPRSSASSIPSASRDGSFRGSRARHPVSYAQSSRGRRMA